MKHPYHILVILFSIAFSPALHAQVKQAINYQAVVRDANGAILPNQSIGVQFSVIAQSNLVVVFQETHAATTNDFGLFNLQIGEGTALVDSLGAVNWGNDEFNLEVAVDVNGGTTYSVIDNTPLVAVPYALYAESAANVNDADADSTNEIQVLSRNGNLISLSRNGGSFTDQVDDADPNPTNEIQVLSINGNQLTLSNGGGTVTVSGGGGITYTAGPGIDITNNVISNTGDRDSTDDITVNSIAGGDVNGPFSNLTVIGIRGTAVTSQTPQNDQILKYSSLSGQWELASGNGINVGFPAGGDLGGFYPNPTVTGIQGVPVSTITPLNCQVLKFKNGQWIPADDSVADNDSDPLNEIQTLSINGFNLSISGVPGSVALPQYVAGTGISILGNVITNTGDINPNDDITIGTIAGGDLSGFFPNLTVSRINGIPLSSATPSLNQILRYNGTQWVPSNDLTNDADADPQNELQSLSISNDTLSLSLGGSVVLPATSPIWTQATGGIYYDSGNVGIGTTDLTYGLNVEETITPNNNDPFTASFTSMASSTASVRGPLFSAEGGGIEAAAAQFQSVQTNANSNAFGFLAFADSASNNTGGFASAGSTGANGSNFNTGFSGQAVNAFDNAGMAGLANGNLGRFNRGVFGLASGLGDTSSLSENFGLYGTAFNNNNFNSGVFGLADGQGVSNFGVSGIATNSATTNYGVFGSASGGTTNYAGYFVGDVLITGTISKAGGTFRIDHPLEPEDKYLVHSFVESPDMLNVYSGNVTTNANGEALVELPGYFEAANKDFRYQLTCIGVFAQAIVAEEISNNRFTIKTDQPNVKVSWQVTAARNDKWAQQHRVEVEESKKENEKGKYLHPELFGADKDKQIGPAARLHMDRKRDLRQNLKSPARRK